MQEAERAGAHVTDLAHDRFWGGYSGYSRFMTYFIFEDEAARDFHRSTD
jgi:hypothetical protein